LSVLRRLKYYWGNIKISEDSSGFIQKIIQLDTFSNHIRHFIILQIQILMLDDPNACKLNACGNKYSQNYLSAGIYLHALKSEITLVSFDNILNTFSIIYNFKCKSNAIMTCLTGFYFESKTKLFFLKR